MFDPVERIVGAFWRQLDSRAAPFEAYEKETKEVGERVIPKAFRR
jgi:hypothetical protein